MEFMGADVSEKDVSKWESPSLAKHLFTISAHVLTKYLQWGFVPTVIYLGLFFLLKFFKFWYFSLSCVRREGVFFLFMMGMGLELDS